jgi:hypothetical protein
VFDASPHNEGLQLNNEEISYVDFLEIENFLSYPPIISWMLVSTRWMTILIFVVKKELTIL